jgi:hypothetical protein
MRSTGFASHEIGELKNGLIIIAHEMCSGRESSRQWANDDY